MKEGRILQGPRLVSRRAFNRAKQGDGIGFQTTEPLRFSERLTGNPAGKRRVSIPRREESQHQLLMGDTGTGKSSLIRQSLIQIAERGETAIVYDPALEYTPHFYQQGRGDQILNPLDERVPYWTPGDEVQQLAETLTLAKSLFPDRPNDTRFFAESARKVFAYLLRYKPNAQQLCRWMKTPSEIDSKLEGSELVPLLDPRAPGQRNGVLASLNLVADAFELLPAEHEARGRWSAADWAGNRRGWLFLPSTHEVRERLLPVVSLWLDMLILRLIRQTDGKQPPVWVILDELASLQKLPQLATALAEGRKANVRIVVGFQGRSQLEARYGAEAETMLSQPMTKIFLRTSEPRAAEWISKAIGEVEIERLHESATRPVGLLRRGGATETWQLDRKVEPLVMASVIAGLPDLSGYIKSQDLAVQAQFPFIRAENRIPGFLPRTLREFSPPQLHSFSTPNSEAISGESGPARTSDAVGVESGAAPLRPSQEVSPPDLSRSPRGRVA